MKKILLATTLLFAINANADMCIHYVKILGETIKKAEKASKENIISELKTNLRLSKHYIDKVIIECEEGSQYYNMTKKMKEVVK